MTQLTEVLQMLCLARIGLLVSQHNTSTSLREREKKKDLSRSLGNQMEDKIPIKHR